MDAIKVRLDGTTWFRDSGGYWVAKIPRLGLFAYGDTAEEARSRVMLAAGMLFEHWTGAGIAEQRLVKHGVAFGDTLHAPAEGDWSQPYTLEGVK